MGNKRYSSWSLRGWLALKQVGIDFEELVLPMDTPEWAAAKADPDLMPAGMVPVLWDGDIAVWESLAIIDWLADRVGRAAFWPEDEAARAFARSIAAEMHAGFAPLRQHCPMNTGRVYEKYALTPEVEANVRRIDTLWQDGRSRFGAGGPYLFGEFGAADIMYAPVVSRFRTYSVPLSPAAHTYVEAVLAHPFMREWYADADYETWRIEKIEL
jgi:glutathione S-transferase